MAITLLVKQKSWTRAYGKIVKGLIDEGVVNWEYHLEAWVLSYNETAQTM